MSAFSPHRWQDLLSAETPQGVVLINEYFARHPERMLGRLALIHGLRSQNEPAVPNCPFPMAH